MEKTDKTADIEISGFSGKKADLFHYTIEQSPEAVFWLDRNGLFTYVNSQASIQLGYSREELLTMHLWDIDPDFPRERWDTHWGELGRIKKRTFETTHRKKTGDIIPVEITAFQVDIGDEEFHASFARDISERKKSEEIRVNLEKQLQRVQKMESLGKLVGGIAHDFNNLLVPMIGYADLGQMGLKDSQNNFIYFEKIKKAAEHAAGLVKQLMAFSRKQVLDIKVLDINSVIGDFKSILRRLIPEDIELITRLSPSPCIAHADRTQLERILLNISINARDAMQKGGTFTIETATRSLDGSGCDTLTEVTPGQYIVISLKDTGEGMDPETQKKIFEPFFTTKRQGKGTGLGLATVFGIVKQHRGCIKVESEPGKGTTFHVFIPESKDDVCAENEKGEGAEETSGNETILVVEDEDIVRKLVTETLSKFGFNVIEADNPEKGLKIASTYAGEIHLLLSDIIMPGMNGKDLYNKIIRIRPDTKVLFMSGYTDDIIFQSDENNVVVNFLQKPFTIHELSCKINAILNK